MKRLAILLLLSGCSPHLVSSNSAGGIVNMTGSLNGQKKAMAQADAECQKYGKVAEAGGGDILTHTMRYRCVKP